MHSGCSQGCDDGGVAAVHGNLCPDIQLLVIVPLQTSVGSTVATSASVSDPDGDVLNVTWLATGGAFANPMAEDTTYNCGVAGTQTLMFTVSDGKCRQTATAQVTCLP